MTIFGETRACNYDVAIETSNMMDTWLTFF